MNFSLSTIFLLDRDNQQQSTTLPGPNLDNLNTAVNTIGQQLLPPPLPAQVNLQVSQRIEQLRHTLNYESVQEFLHSLDGSLP